MLGVLGPVEARPSPERAWVGLPPQQHLLLALLAVHLGRACGADRAVEALWGDDPPEAGGRRVGVLVSRLRQVLESLTARGSGSARSPTAGGWICAPMRWT